jgi:hypothetical protein
MKETDPLQDLSVEGRITEKLILNEQRVSA